MQLAFRAVMGLFAVSQVYWLYRAFSLISRFWSGWIARVAIFAAVLASYWFALKFFYQSMAHAPTPTHLTLTQALFVAPFGWWLVSSLIAFIVLVPFHALVGLVRLVRGWFRDGPLVSPGRRQFLEQSSRLVIGAPFVAGGYGVLYGRLNLETTTPRIRLRRLPSAFHGFRIAQLSDIHIGPFMTEDQVRRYVQITNALKPDLIVLTGDYVTWDASTQHAVVSALAGLHAPHGVIGCLGNHEIYTQTEDSISTMFGQAGIPILRQARAPIRSGADELNLMGIDFPYRDRVPDAASLLAADRVNILLSHAPQTFDYAAGLGIDLTLSGHTHGGQVALEFVRPDLTPTRLMTPYVAGHFEQAGCQLYVNRGIGTIGVPIRLGAPPEITVFELVRA
jgi:predicted MPP superfamily phosphohydrolase